MSRVTWQWLAGFTDGDGCIWMPPADSPEAMHPSRCHVTWYQTEARISILFAIEEFLDLHEVEVKWHLHKSQTNTLSPNKVWHLTVRGSDNVEFVLRQMKPYLIGPKREYAFRVLKRLKKLPRGRIYTKRAFCQRGHRMRGENVYVRPNGFRQCRQCIRLSELRRDRKKVPA